MKAAPGEFAYLNPKTHFLFAQKQIKFGYSGTTTMSLPLVKAVIFLVRYDRKNQLEIGPLGIRTPSTFWRYFTKHVFLFI